MKIKIMLDDGAIMPTRAHHADAGLDLYTPRDVAVPSIIETVKSLIKMLALLPAKQSYDYLVKPSEEVDTGVHVEIPFGFFGDIRSKSGLLFKDNIITDGTVDSGYTGSIQVKLINLGIKPKIFKAGDKIAQMVIQRCELPELVAVEEIASTTERGDNGFGSTGR